MSCLLLTQQALASSAWVPISNGDLTTIIPVPKVEVNGTGVYTSGDNMKILLGDIGATTAYYYRLRDNRTGALGPLQCTTAETAKAQGNALFASPGVTSGSYSFQVSACMAGSSCNVSAFESGNLACSEFGNSNQFTYQAVNGTRTPSVSDATNEHIGTIAAQFRVTESGAATYSIPISLPTGTAGVMPQVSLNYSSQAGEGLMGQGWSLSAASAITRCGKTPVYDGKQGGVDLTTKDRLCYNGQRLLKNRTANTKYTNDIGISDSSYWATSAIYHTATDGFVRVTPHYYGATIRAFTVENKAGEVHYYGDVSYISSSKKSLLGKSLARSFKKLGGSTTNGRSDAYIHSKTSTSKASTWLIKAVQDVKGNYFVYNYNHFYNKYGTHYGESYLTSIDYTGNTVQGTAPYATVAISYKDSKKLRSGWAAGSPVLSSKLISKIEVKVDGALYRKYTPNYYESDFQDEKNFLESLTECAGDGKCNAPISFNWQKPAAITTQTEQRCTTEDTTPKTKMCYDVPVTDPFKPFSGSYSKSISSRNNHESLVFDFNGDGFSDILYPDGSWKVKYGPSFTSTKTISGTSGLTGFAEYARIMDFDGDGVLDLLAASGTTSNWKAITNKKVNKTVRGCRTDRFYGENECWTNTVQVNVQDTGVKASGLKGSTQILDVDGDSLQDIVFSSGATFYVFRNLGNKTFAARETLISVPTARRTDIDDYTTISHTIFNGDSMYGRTGGAKNATVLDFDGDGITDLLVGRKTSIRECSGNYDPLSAPLNQSTQQAGSSLSNNLLNESTSTDSSLAISKKCNTSYDIAWYLYSGKDWSKPVQEFGQYEFSSPKAVDLNGDGLTDIAWRSGSRLRYRLSDGTKLLSRYNAKIANRYGGYEMTFNDDQEDYSYFMDVSSDGRTDLLISNTAQNSRTTYFSLPVKGHPDKVYFQARGSWSFDKNKMTQFADINGDAKVDLLQGDSSNWKVYYSKDAGKLMNVISRVDNGHGITNQITYASITNTYSNFANNQVATYIQKESMQGLNSDGTRHKDYVAPKTGMFMVSRVDSLTNSDKTSAVIYQYGGLLMHKKGFGNLGFELLRTLDLQTCGTGTYYKTIYIEDDDGTRIPQQVPYSSTNYDDCVATTTTYNQLAPFTGMPKSTTKTLGVGSGAVLLSKATNEYTTKGTINGGQQVYLSKSTDLNYALNSDLSSSSLASRTVTTQTQDYYGNVLTNNVAVDNKSQGNTSSSHYSKVNTSNSYGTLAIDKRMGRLSSSTVVKSYKTSGVSDSSSNTVSFKYNSDKLLESETTGLGKTTHGYDKWGNQISSTLVVNDSSGNVDNERSSSKEYDTRGRYVIHTTNAKGFVTTNKFRTTSSGGSFTTLPRGRIMATESYNEEGSNVKKYLNGFGVVYKTVSNTGSQSPTLLSQTFTRSCSSVTCGVSGAYQRVISAASGVPEIHTYLDAWGRELQTKKRLFDNSWQVVAKSYDARGRAEWVSEPNKNSVSGHKTRFEYDRIGRVKKETKPDGSTVTRQYNGLQTTTTDAKGNKLRVTNNFAGQKTFVENLSSSNAVLTKLTYVYDANNNLLNSKVYKGSTYSHTQSTLTYDNYGRKESMTDLDKGNWTYDYNGFGELVSQKNSSNQTVQLRYDELGRKIARLDVDGLTCWEYDTELQGKLSRVAYKEGSGQSTNTCSDSNWPSNPNYQEQYTYGHNHLLAGTTTTIDGEAFHTQVMYDEFNRVKYTQYPANGFTVEHGYNSRGMPTTLKNVTQGHRDYGKVYQEIKATDARGNVTDVRFANGVKQTKGHNAQTGYIEAMSLTKGNSVLHNQNFKFDALGNLEERKHNFGYGGSAHDYCETFGYDSLNRLDWSRTKVRTTACSRSSGIYKNYNYDALGNFTYKAGAGYYTYHNNIKNRVLKVTSGANGTGTTVYNFSKYDNRGNVLNDGSRTFTYTSYDKPSRITKGSIATDMSYDHGRNLYRRVDHRSDGITDTLYVKGLYERVKGSNGVTEHKYYVGNTVVTDRSNGKHDTLYLHKDHLGSTTSITNASGAVVQHINYDAWGQQNRFHTSGNLSTLLQQQSPAESKGYTGHKELSDLGIIHMGGRIYDAKLGRFLQADPHIQAPMNSQNYNRYSYVLNNPMSYTDPSGYFFKKLLSTVQKVTGTGHLLRAIANVPLLNMAVQIGISFACGPAAPACLAAYSGAQTFALTGSLNASIKAGAIAYASGKAFQKIGGHFSKLNGATANSTVSFGGNMLTPIEVFQQISAHAMVGGISAELQGGKFGHGFISAGVTKAAGGAFLPGGADIDGAAELAKNTVISAVIGGTASVLSGGKFANGAQTAAMQYLLNQASMNMKRELAVRNAIRNARMTFNDNKSLNNVESGMSIATYVYEDSELGSDPNRFSYDFKVKAQAANGFTVDSAPFVGYGTPESVSDWVIALLPGKSFNNYQMYRAIEMNVSSVYTIDMNTNKVTHHTYNASDNNWYKSSFKE